MLEHARPHLAAGFRLARVVQEHREAYVVREADREMAAEVAGRLRFSAEHREDFPAVGDWVMISGEGEAAVIHAVLPRRTMLARKAAGDRTGRQPIAVNLDLVFVMQALDRPSGVRRLERSLVVVRESGAMPVMLLSKCDLPGDDSLTAMMQAASGAAPDVEVIPCSVVSGAGIDRIRTLVTAGVTACFIGPSGAGKSTLVNCLAGTPMLRTGDVREIDARGCHTTTTRQMVLLPSGGMVIDTPGMRELGLWEDGGGIEETFPEIGSMGEGCRFRDCTHSHEPGCAVRRAVEQGLLPAGRFESYQKLRAEARSMAERTTIAGRLEQKRKGKIMSREIRRFLKRKGKP